MAEQSFDYCIRALATDVGRKRSANEDHLGERVTPNGLVTVVCDGMGGHVGGAVASHIAVDAILDYLTQNYFDNPDDAIVAAVSQANDAILQRAAEDPSLAGMGSTCVMIIVRDGLVHYGWVGDSRIYLIRQNSITQLSKDQSVVQALVDAGQLTPAEAEHHARKNEITNCLGIAAMTPAVVGMRPIRPQAGDSFLLCSDGLSGMVNDRAIAEIISNRSGMRLQQRAEQLIATANANGGLDNITALLLEFPSGSIPTEPNSGRMTAPISSPSGYQHEVSVVRSRKSPLRNVLLWGGVGLVSLLATGAIIMYLLPDDGNKPGGGAAGTTEDGTTNNTGTGADDVKPFGNVSFALNLDKKSLGDHTAVQSVINFVRDKNGVWEVQDDAGKKLCSFTGTLTLEMIKVSEGFTVENCRKMPKGNVFSIYPVNAAEAGGRKLTVTIDQQAPAAGNKKADEKGEAKKAKTSGQAEPSSTAEETADVSSPTITFEIQLKDRII